MFLEQKVKERILSFKPQKGDKGAICVIGGSFEYSGAPYFSAISSLRTGADLAFVICDKYAASVIKTYSPELIVYGLFDYQAPEHNIEIPIAIERRVSTIIVGPGLSRNTIIQKQAFDLLHKFHATIPIIFDGDGIYLFKNSFTEFCTHFKSIIITPNANELNSLKEIDLFSFENIVVYAKGEVDRIYSANVMQELDYQGIPRRCGGLGDILCGVIAALISMNDKRSVDSYSELFICLSMSGKILREACIMAFNQKGRSMSAIDVIKNIGSSLNVIFE